jgi:double-stranded uracil-DNA glycosylase
MSHIRSFSAIANKNCRVLILGSMPGEESLKHKEYYAHKQNQFWHIMEHILDTEFIADKKRKALYKRRVKALLSQKIALWDVLHSCKRRGSLDSDIREEIANDFAEFFASYPRITHVFFNGGKAEKSFQRFVLPSIDKGKIKFKRLPSTSPAHAGMSIAKKKSAWKKAIRRALG